MKKRNLINLGALLMVAFIMASFVACGRTTTSETSSVATKNAESTSSEELTDVVTEEYTIAWIGWGNTDYVGNSIQSYLEYLDEQMPEAKWVYSDAGIRGSDAMVADAEAFCQSGVDAIIAYLPSAAMADVCAKYKVWLGAATNLITDQKLLDYLDASGIWLGYNPHGKEYEEGWRACETMYNEGDRKFVVLGSTPGHPAGDERIRGMLEFIESKEDAVLINSYQGDDRGTALSDMIALYGNEIEAIGMTSAATGGGLETIMSMLGSSGVDAHVAILDMSDSAEQGFDSGILKYISAGNLVDPGIMGIVALNAIMGYYNGPVNIFPDYLAMYNKEDYINYINAVDGEIPPYTADELRQWMQCYNPDATGEGYKKYIESTYTLKSILERHADLLK